MRQFSVLFSVLIIINTWKVNAGAPCVISESCEQHGLPGVYSLDMDCPHFMKLNPDERYGHGWCSFSGSNAVICCIGARPKSNIRKPNKLPQVIHNRMAEVCEDFGTNNYSPVVDRIFGGAKSYPGEFPHFAALGYRELETISFNCGGALITDMHVLTAAHCCIKTKGPHVVRLGANSLNVSLNDGHVDIEIERVTRHPDYSPRKKYNDIAVIKLQDPVTFGPFIWPACLTRDNTLQADKSLIIAGFGRTDEADTTRRSEFLQQAYVREVPLTECRSDFIAAFKGITLKGLPEGITDDLICAINKEKVADACQGDSGSPLKVKIGNNFYVVGVTSFGIGCGTSLPSFYTKVSSYIDWIESVISSSTTV